jgi:hypothetical protein
MRKLYDRIERLEAVLPRVEVSQASDDSGALFMRAHGERVEQFRQQIKEQGPSTVAQRMLEAGSELEQLALLSKLGHCRHQILLIDALHRQDDGDDLLRWWRATAPAVLRQLAEGNKVEFAEYRFDIPEFASATDNVSALRIYEAMRLKRYARQQSTATNLPRKRLPATQA